MLLAYLVGPLAGRGQELYSIASDREQAGLLFAIAEQILRQCPELLDKVNIIRHRKVIENKHGSIYKTLASDAGRLYGLNPNFCVYDELGSAKSRRLHSSRGRHQKLASKSPIRVTLP